MTFPTLQNQPLPNFPKPLDTVRAATENYSFPENLTNSDKRNFYSYIGISDYSIMDQFNIFQGFHIPVGAVKLPIPTKLDDNLVLNWGQVAATDALLSKAGSSATGLLTGVGILTGVALNPLMFLQFQRPDLRTFSLSWALTPKNEKESEAIKNIITKLKQAASPKKLYIPGFIGYPQVLHIKMYPDDIFGHMVFKPCVITSVQASYTGGPSPSFLNSKNKKGAPTVVTLTLNLMEMQFWYRNEIT